MYGMYSSLKVLNIGRLYDITLCCLHKCKYLCVDKTYAFSRIEIAKIFTFMTMTVGINQNFVIFFNYTKTFIQNTHSNITYHDIIVIWSRRYVHHRTSDDNNDTISAIEIIILLLHIHNISIYSYYAFR